MDNNSSARYYQIKEKQKKTRERCQNLSQEEKEQECQCACEQYKNVPYKIRQSSV